MNINLFRTMMNSEKTITFISRCPANFSDKLEERVIRKAHEENNWEDLGQISVGKRASYYKVQES